MLHPEDHYTNELNRLLENNSIERYYSHDLIHFKEIGYGGFASVHVAKWNNTPTKYAVKKFVVNKELCYSLTDNIFYITYEEEERYSLILEYAEGGTLKDYLRNKIIEWSIQLMFAREITSAILWLHNYKGIVHGDLHPNNILLHKGTIKLADFRRSFEKGKGDDNTQLNEKSDIYCLGVLFWKLASSSLLIDSPEDNYITFGAAVPNTNDKFTVLYQINETLSSIDNDESTVSDSEESEYSYQIDLNKLCQKL
ncbi:unnamed protein product [Rhizophagus irregularis]|uniref:Protein kinase domain-containing protein n=1 Tax=Rhizophagus irregularis TaxID=588596 RepID=A0A915Z1R9_9GLOM|nr:unnamed protein product [Rhizophagus irregularis]CAB5358011.1 unnamed protein product [Rhizophagus irregularis]